MSAAAVLLTYAVLLVMAGPWLLVDRAWSDRAPRLAIIAWQCLTVSVLVAVALAGVAVVLRACTMVLDAQDAALGGLSVAAAGATCTAMVLGRLGWFLAAELRQACRRRAVHRAVLDLVGTPVPELGVVVLNTDRLAVYCLPGRHRRIVVTSGALRLLNDEQLALVLRHERAHARQRHDLVLAWSQTTARSFPWIPVFVTAHAESARLVEILADDVAIGSAGNRLALADALLTLSGSCTPAAALAAGGSSAGARVRRLISPHRRLGRLRAILIGAMAIGLLLAPLAVIVGPAAAVTGIRSCPTAAPTTQAPAAGTAP